MKVVIARDRDGFLAFWPIGALENLRKTFHGDWRSPRHKRILYLNDDTDCFRGACKLLGFTPRKGSKEVVDIPVKRLKK